MTPRTRAVMGGIGIWAAVALGACGGAVPAATVESPAATVESPAATEGASVAPAGEPSNGEISGLFAVGDARNLFLRCTGEGSPTVILEAGDGDTKASYGFAEATLASDTRTCVYDRANLGLSDPAP